MATQIRAGLLSLATVSMGELDTNYSDTTRVLRLSGAHNTEARLYSEIIGQDDGSLVRHRLDALRDAYLPELIPKPKDKSPLSPKQLRERKLIHLYNTYSLHMAWLEDIVILRELRKAADMPEDYRRMVFLYRYWSCFCVGSKTTLEAALAFYQGFPPALKRRIAGYTERREGI